MSLTLKPKDTSEAESSVLLDIAVPDVRYKFEYYALSIYGVEGLQGVGSIILFKSQN